MLPLHTKSPLLSCLALSCLFTCSLYLSAAYEIKTAGLVVSLSADGTIQSIAVNGKKFEKPVSAFSTIEGCRQAGPVIVKKTDDGAICFERTLVHDSLGQSCVVTDRFVPTSNSVRWEMGVKGKGGPWGSVIQTRIHYPAGKGTLFWTTWGAPQYNPASVDASLAKRLKAHDVGSKSRPGKDSWADPLIPVPFSDTTYFFGSPSFDCMKKDERDDMGYVPLDKNVICIPVATVVEPGRAVGLTFALSPEDDIIDLTMSTSAEGDIVFKRLFNRISSARDCLFSMDITAHAADWRPALAWMSRRYPAYFNPVNPNARILGGTGAYSNHKGDFDTGKMKKMCFTVNWQASFDFPYMGMFLPPVGPNEPWKRFQFGDETTIKAMNDYAAGMKARGFFVLNYFNVTEFGARIKYPPPPLDTSDKQNIWKDCQAFLYLNLPGAILPRTDKCVSKPEYKGATPPEPWHSWRGCVAMDCGDPAYRDFLLDQARRHVAEIPDAFGICIDRLDWLRLVNERADDGITWFDGKPARSLITSWNRLMRELAPIFHNAGKFILVNNEIKRIDILNHTDGIFDEFTYAGAALNLSAFLTLNRPALGWTDVAATPIKGGDDFFQRYLYLGVFPMCPFPKNHHSIQPDDKAEQLYMEYGPLMKLMQGAQWVLEPHAVSVENDLAKVNMFQIPGGFSIPVVYGGENKQVRVIIANIKGLNAQTTCEAYYPGAETPASLEIKKTKNGWLIDVPLTRGCAMIKLTLRNH